MRFALSTNWNTRRHSSANALIEEIKELGFDALELGYHTTMEMAEGIRQAVEKGEIEVNSVHAFCPVPLSAPHGYPELYLLASLDDDEQAMAILHLRRTLELAQAVNARAVVLHAGRIMLRQWWQERGTGTLVEVLSEYGADSPQYARALTRARKLRSKRVKPHFERFCNALNKLLPHFEGADITLALENLPSIEAFPDQDEMILLKERFSGASLAYWHDIGHSQLRGYMQWDDPLTTSARLLPFTRGVHIHDTQPLMQDHLTPGRGNVDFAALAAYAAPEIIKVFEPASQIKGGELASALQLMRQLWSTANQAKTNA